MSGAPPSPLVVFWFPPASAACPAAVWRCAPPSSAAWPHYWSKRQGLWTEEKKAKLTSLLVLEQKARRQKRQGGVYEDTKVQGLALDCDFRVGTRLQRVLKPNLMCVRLFCSADMCVVLRLCQTHTNRGVLTMCRLFQRKYSNATDVLSRFKQIKPQSLLLVVVVLHTNLILFILYRGCAAAAAADQRLWTRDLIQPTWRALTWYRLTVNCIRNI